MTQPEAIQPSVDAVAPRLPLDLVRLEQFLDLQQSLLATRDDVGDLPVRMLQLVGTFLRVPGAALGLVEAGQYHIVASVGVDPSYCRRFDGSSAADGPLAPVLGEHRAVVLADDDGSGACTVALPVCAAQTTGALHLVLARGTVLRDRDAHLARAIATLAGLALANEHRHRELARVAAIKGDALTAMAHDLRAPLNSLIGYASLLREGAFGALTGEQREIAATLERQALEVVDLLGATLDVARLEAGRLPLHVEAFPLHAVLDTLRTSTFARPTHDGRIRWSVPVDLPAIRSDRVKVKQIVQNLVDNALKHANGHAVDVTAHHLAQQGAIRLAVTDSGPGIDAGVIPHLFEPFRGAPGRGTGFGLYIVRAFSEALGASIDMQTAAGRGTTIAVALPLEPPLPAAAAAR